MSALHSACDRAAIHAAPGARGRPRPGFVLATSILASSLAFIDGSVVNVGLPAIGRSLAADPAGLQWIVNAYLLPLSALLLLGGALGDRFGRRRVLVLGIAVFALASVACAAAAGLGMLLGGRLLQGIGAALLMPNSLALLGQHFTGEAKGRAIGIWAATGAAVGAAAPLLGGWLIDLGSWRAIFLINLPLAAAAIALAIGFVPRDARADGRPLDWPGGLLATSGLAALTWALTAGTGPGGWHALETAGAAASVLLLLLFGLVEWRRGERAAMPLHLFASRNFATLTLFTLLLYGALGGLLVLLPFVLISAAQYSATQAGAALLPLPAVLAVLSPTMGRIAGRTGARVPLSLGPLVVAGGFLLAGRIGAAGAYWTTVLPAVLVMALGMSGAVAPLTTAVLGSVDERHVGSASGFNSAIARSGGLIATALLGGVLAASGTALLGSFRLAMLCGALCCICAATSAWFGYKNK